MSSPGILASLCYLISSHIAAAQYEPIRPPVHWREKMTLKEWVVRDLSSSDFAESQGDDGMGQGDVPGRGRYWCGPEGDKLP